MTRSDAGSGKVVTLSDLLAQPLPYEDVPVPEYGDGQSIRLNAVTGVERKRLAALQDAGETNADRLQFQFELIAAALGPGHKVDDVALLPSALVDRLAKVSLKMTGIAPAAVDDAAEALKATASADSGSS